MGADYTGKVIMEARKMKGLTQKQLADTLGVTDKAVSKWERGINYPDIALFKPLSDILDVSLSKLICGDGASADEAVEAAATISQNEKAKLARGLMWRWGLVIVVMLLIICSQIYVSNRLYNMGIYGWMQALTSGMIGFSGFIVGNAVVSIVGLRRIM